VNNPEDGDWGMSFQSPLVFVREIMAAGYSVNYPDQTKATSETDMVIRDHLERMEAMLREKLEQRESHSRSISFINDEIDMLETAINGHRRALEPKEARAEAVDIPGTKNRY
jgi:hypothetical protein